MGSLVLSFAIAFLQGQTDPIGELSKTDLLNLISSVGYKTTNLRDPYQSTIKDRTVGCFLVVSYQSRGHNTPFVRSASGRVEFYLPKFLGKSRLQNLVVREKLNKVRVSSFISGRVVLEGNLADPTTTMGQLKSNVANLMDAIRRLTPELAPLGGKVAADIYGAGDLRVDPNIRLDSIDEEDFDFLRMQLGWGENQSAGGHGWITGAEPLGVKVMFNGMERPESRVFIYHGVIADPKWVARSKKVLASVKWSEVLVQENYIHIQRSLDLSKGMSVGEVTMEILDFARRVKGLGIVPQRVR